MYIYNGEIKYFWNPKWLWELLQAHREEHWQHLKIGNLRAEETKIVSSNKWL